MHAIEGYGVTSVPAFLTKLWRLVEDENTQDMIRWTQSGRSFIIENQAKFARELLPQYYKHNNMASFVRQLNMYGFHKVVSADSGGLRPERDEMEFAHQHFLRGKEHLLENIKRKQQRRLASDEEVIFTQIPTGRSVTVEDNKNVTKLLNDLKDMKRDQDNMSSKLLNLKRENEALWREYASMRQKFTKQQQIIEKLIHFLVAMVKSPSKGLISKRKFGHLALEGGEESSSSKINTLHQFSQGSPLDILGESEISMTGGAQIQEVTEDTDLIHGNVIPSPEYDVNSPTYPVVTTEVNAGTVQNFKREPQGSTNMPSDTITATSVRSPEGTLLVGILDDSDSQLSPELLNAVNPSAVTQSIKYPVSTMDALSTSSACSSGDIGGSSVSERSNTIPKSSVNIQVHAPSQKGKKKMVQEQLLNQSHSSSMSVAVPENTIYKREFQSHVDDMQSSIENLQDILSNANLNLDTTMLSSVFGSDNYLPELDSMGSAISGNELSLSLYNPTLLDLAENMEEENESDPFAFLTDNLDSTSTSPSSITTSTSLVNTTPACTTTATTISFGNTSIPRNVSTQPPPPKHLKLTIKKEKVPVESSLQTPVPSPMASNSLSRVKRYGK